MLAKIKQLEAAARCLELDKRERFKLAKNVERYTDNFFHHLTYSSQIYTPDVINPQVYKALSIHEQSSHIDEILSLLKSYIIDPGLNSSSARFLGYIPGGGIYPAALGDYIAAITNRFAGIFTVSPGAARLDNILIRWMCHLVGYDKMAGGNLSSGGSLANFIGIVTARESFNIRSKFFNRLVVYTSSQVHYSVLKALKIAGLGDAYIRYIAIDEDYRLQADKLEETIIKDKKKKLIPWLIVATMGTTNTGAIDPIEDISHIALNHRLWLHIDAAYGGFFLLCPSQKKKLRAIKQADSITIDPHKGLFIPYGLGVILVKDEYSLLNAYDFHQIDYLPNFHDDPYKISPASLSPELSVHFRALRMWMPLKLYGLKPFRAALQEKLLLARFFYHALLKVKNIEIAAPPQLSVVAFRYRPRKGSINQFNRLLSEKTKESGIFFSTTFLNGNLFLRMACLNFRTHLDTIQQALSVLQHAIKTLNNS